MNNQEVSQVIRIRRPMISFTALRIHCAGFVAAFAVTAATAGPKDGLLDLAFTPSVPVNVSTVAAVGDGYFLAAESIIRLHRDGSVDGSFQCPLRAEGPFESFASVRPTGDGGLIVAGAFHTDSTNYNVAKVDATGAVDPQFFDNSFGPPIPASIITECLVDSRGRIYVDGPFQIVNGLEREWLVRLLPNGTLDPTFVLASGVVASVGKMVLTPDDKLLLVAGFDSESIVRLDDDGAVDPSFVFPPGYTGIGPLRVSGDGRIAATARKTIGDGYDRLGVYVFQPTGAVDPTFDSGFDFSGIYDLVWDGDRIVASAVWSEFAGVQSRSLNGVVRFNADGSSDSNWTGSAVADLPIRQLVRDERGSILVRGRFELFAGVPRAGLARLNRGADMNLQWFNTSARGTVSPTGPLIVGFVVGGNAPQRVLVRGVGPSLSQFGISDPLVRPSIRVHRGESILLEKRGWWNTFGVREAAESAGAFELLPLGDDAADLMILPPGVYTLVVASDDGSSGTALAEVYTLDVN